MVDIEYTKYKKQNNEEGNYEGLTPCENNYTSSQYKSNSLTPSSSTNNNNYTPMEVIQKDNLKKDPLYTGGQCSKRCHYISDFILIGFNIFEIILYFFGTFNIFVFIETFISLASSFYLLYCLIKNKDLKKTYLALIFFIDLLPLAARMYGYIQVIEKLNDKDDIYGLYLTIGYFNFVFKVFFDFIFGCTTSLS